MKLKNFYRPTSIKTDGRVGNNMDSGTICSTVTNSLLGAQIVFAEEICVILPKTYVFLEPNNW